MQPANLFAHAEALVALDRLGEAVDEYGELIHARLGGGDAFLRRGLVQERLGRLPEAAADFHRAAELDPSTPWAHLRLAQMLHRRGRLHLAAEAVEQAMAREPWNGEARITAAAIFTELGWLDRAAATARALGEVEGWWGEARRAAQDAYARRRTGACDALRRGSRPSPADRDARLELAWTLFALGRLRASRALCEALMREAPDAFAPFALRARIVAREDGPAGAAAFLRAVGFLHGGVDGHRSALAALQAEAGPL